MEGTEALELLLGALGGAAWTLLCVFVGKRIGRMQERRYMVEHFAEWQARHLPRSRAQGGRQL